MEQAEVEKKASQVLIKSHYEEASRCINQGITCDENDERDKANNYYNKALRSINVGLAMKYEGKNEHDVQKLKEVKEKLKKLKSQVEDRLEVLNKEVDSKKKMAPVRPPPPSITVKSQQKTPHNYIPKQHNNEQINDVQSWEDARELLSIKDGVTMFFVSLQGHVTTLYQPQTIRALQLLNYNSDSGDTGAFLHCGSWVFPLIPGRSPILKTEDRTFMIPDINLDNQNEGELAQGKFATVGLVFTEDISEDKIKRFERILKCYADFRHYTPPPTAPTAPTAERSEDDRALPSTLNQPSQSALVPVVGDTTVSENNVEQSNTWGSKVSKGIEVGAVIISWGLSKGAEIGGTLINQGSEKLRGKIKPNEEPAKIDSKIEDNVRQIKTAAGVACQVSSAIVSAVSALTRELGKQLAPVIVEQGSKLLPASAKQDGSKGKNHIQEFVKVAVGGVQGIAVVHEGLTTAWKILYTSLSEATVTTVDHKYGEQAGRITGDAMGAVGNAVEAYHNVNHLGYKALAKKAVKDTGKECVYDANKKFS